MQSDLDDFDQSIKVLYDSKKSDLYPEQKLSLAMIVLTIQDLNLEPHFPDLRKHFIIPKTKKIKKTNVIQALEYLHDTTDHLLSFGNCCYYLKLETNFLKKHIVSKIKLDSNMVHDVYKTWRILEVEQANTPEDGHEKGWI